jgi:hypothetical protein
VRAVLLNRRYASEDAPYHVRVTTVQVFGPDRLVRLLLKEGGVLSACLPPIYITFSLVAYLVADKNGYLDVPTSDDFLDQLAAVFFLVQQGPVNRPYSSHLFQTPNIFSLTIG